MGDIKTPRDAKGSRSLKVLQKTSASVYAGKMPARSARNMKHAHALKGARQIVRIDRQPWEERVAAILHVLEDHRYGRSNAMHNAINDAEQAKQMAMQKMAEVETYAEEMQAANEEMRATNEEMQVITEEMERSSMDLERFVPTADENIRVPLRDICVDADQLAEKYADKMSDEDRQTLENMAAKADQMEMLLQSVLTYWRVNMTAAPFAATDTDLIFEDVLLALDEKVMQTKAQVSHDPLPTLLADKDQLTMVFEILMDNALSFAGDVPPNLHVSAQNIGEEQIKIPNSEISTGWLFSFRDRGMGVDPELASQLFHFFSSGKHQGEADGIGMGLATAWKIIRRHGGRIWVEPNPGGGSVFNFTIPEREF